MNKTLHHILKEIRQETGVPAISGIVVSHNRILAQAATGVRRLGHDEPITVHDMFHTGSNAKAMTATLCAAMIHNQLLSWHTTPIEVFPELVHNILPEYKAITLEMLLRHMAGIPPYMDDEAEDYILPNWEGIASHQQITYFAKWILQNRPPVNVPGTKFSYSNAGYSIAGAMVESITGKKWKELLQGEVFLPLGIEASAGNGWPALQAPNQPWGHLLEDGTLIPHPPDDVYQLEPFLAPAGDVCISLPQYGRFLQMHLRGLQNRNTILPSEFVQRMHNYSKLGNGMGWGVVTLRSLEKLGLFSTHAGSAGTFILVAGISHRDDFAAALATNASNPTAMQGIKKIIAHYAGTE